MAVAERSGYADGENERGECGSVSASVMSVGEVVQKLYAVSAVGVIVTPTRLTRHRWVEL